MISTKKLIKMAKKWQKLAAASRRKISWPKLLADKGHFVVYSNDGKRFMIPLIYLKSEILRELLRMADDEFGMTSDGPITLPSDSSFIEYAISILQRNVAEDLEKALICTLSSCRSSSTSYSQQNQTTGQVIICSF